MAKKRSNKSINKVARKEALTCLCLTCDSIFVQVTTIHQCVHPFCKKCILEEGLKSCPYCNEKFETNFTLEDTLSDDHEEMHQKVKSQEVNPGEVDQAEEVKAQEGGNKCNETCRVVNPKLVDEEAVKKYEKKGKAKVFSSDNEEDEEIPILVTVDDQPESSSCRRSKRIAIKKSLNSMFNYDFLDTVSSKGRTTVTKKRSNAQTKTRYKSCPKMPLSPARLPEIGDDVKQIAKAEEALKRVVDLFMHDPSMNKNSRKDKGKEKVIEQESPVNVRDVNSTSAARDMTTSATGALMSTRRPDGLQTGIWFNLVADPNQKGDAPLRQITPSYLKVLNSNAPISSIATYVAKKLGLNSGSEVEIKVLDCYPLMPIHKLGDVLQFWLDNNLKPRPEKFEVEAGSSAKDFIMKLTYARKLRD